MEQPKRKPQLIGDKRTAAIALCSTGLVAIQSFRIAFSHAQYKPHWLVPLDFASLPIWVSATVNLAFYVCFLWVGVEFYRGAQGMERIVVVGWFNVIFLTPAQNLVSTPLATAIQWVKAAGIVVAFLTAIYIFFKSPAAAGGTTKLAKQRLFVLCAVIATALVLGALMYFVPLR